MERTVTIEERDSIDKEKYTVLGTGFFINNEGHILTCYHVVRNKTKVWINLGGTQKHLQAKVIGDDYKYDLALLKAEFEDPIPTKIPHITIPYEEFPARGTEYISFGASHGRRDTLIKGYVANIVNKGIADDRPEEYYLQLSEPVLSGSSGGPVIDLSGKLIGMNRFTYSLGGKGTFGPGFAIPTDILYNFVKNQKEVVSVKTKAMRGIIEIPFTTMYLVKKLNLPDMAGVIVSYPEKDSAAEKAGIKRYDYITHLNGKQIHGFFEFFEDMKKIDKKE
ncbi:MAG: serine protease, partial [Leptospiraceae bacterium]|nr:serine protease [Leptospiraceae bacterium]